MLGRELTIVGARRRHARATSSSSTASASSRSSTSATSPARSRPTATSSTSTPATPRARAALECTCAATTSTSSPSRRHPRADLRAAPGVGAAGRGPRDPARRREGLAAPGRRCCLRIGELQRTKLLDAEKAFDAYARCVPRGPVDRGRQGSSSRRWPPLIDDGWARLVKLFEEALGQRDRPRSRARPRARDEGRARLRGPARRQREGGRVLPEGARDRARRSPRARRARVDLHPRREVPRAARDLSPPASTSRTSPTSALRLPVPHRLDPRGDAGSARRGDRDLQRDPRPGRRRPQGAARARPPLRPAPSSGAISATTSAASSRSSSNREQVALLVRLAQLRETHLGEVAAAVETYRQVLDHEDQNRDAVQAPRAADHEPRARARDREHPRADLQGARASGHKQIGVYEIMAQARLRSRAQDRAAPPDLRAPRDRRRRRRRRVRDLRARAARGSAQRDHPGPARSAGPWARQVAAMSRRSTTRSPPGHRRGRPQGRAAVPARPDPGARAPRRQGRGRDLRARARRSPPGRSRPPPRSRRSTSARATGRLGRHPKRKSEILLTNLEDRKQLLYRAAQIEEEVLGNADAAIAIFRQVLDRSTTSTCRRWTRSSGCTSGSRAGSRSRTSTRRRPTSPRTRTTRSRCSTCSAQVYDRELGDVAKAIETYQAHPRSRRRRAARDPGRSTGSTARPSAGTTCSATSSARSSSPRPPARPSRSSTGSATCGRSGSATWRGPSRATARRSTWIRSHAETLHALDGLRPRQGRAGDGGPRARADLRGRRRVRQARRRARGDGHAQRGSAGARSSCSTASRGSTSRASATRTPRSTRYARALRDDSGQRSRRSATSSGSPTIDRHLGAARRALQRRGRQVARRARARSICCRGSRASTSRSSADVDKAIATLPQASSTSSSTTSPRCSRSTGSTARPGSGRSSPRSCVARSSSPRPTSEIADAAVPARPGARDPARRPQGRRRGLSRDPDARSRTHAAGARPRSRSMFHDGPPPDRDRPGPRAALRGGRRVRASCTRSTRSSSASSTGRRPPGDVPAPRRARRGASSTIRPARARAGGARPLVEDPRLGPRARGGRAARRRDRRLGRLVAGLHRARSSAPTPAPDERRPAADAAPARPGLRVRAPTIRRTRSRPTCGCSSSTARIPTRSPRSTGSTSTPGCTTTSPRSCAAASRSSRIPTSSSSCTSGAARSSPTRSAISSSRSPATHAVLDQESRNRRALEAIESIHFRREDWKRLFETYEKLIDVADADDEMADIYARMARICSDALERGGQGDRPARAACSTSAARSRRRWPRWPTSTTRREKWEELVEIIERQIAVAPGDHDQIVLYKHLGRVWEEKLGRERNALDAWLAADRIDGNDLETLRALAGCTGRPRRGTSCRRPIRRIIDVGQLNGAITENETIELYAQLGQLEGDVLGRVDEAVEAWRQVIAIDPSDFRALGALESLFVREGRWEESIDVLEKRALVLDDEDAAPRDPAPGRRRRGRRRSRTSTRAAQVYERVAPARSDATGRVASGSRRSTASSTSGPSSSRSCSSAPRSSPTSSSRSRCSNQVAKIYETEIGDQESRVLRAPGRVQARLRARGDRARARAPRHGDQPLAGAARRVHQPRQRARAGGPRRGRGPVGQDRPLVRRAPVAPRVRDPLGAAGAAHRSRAHRRARRHRRPAAQARQLERADRDPAAPRGRRAGAREEDRAVPRARRAARAPDAGHRRRDPRLPAGARPRPDLEGRARSRSIGCTAAPSSGSR